MESAWHSGRSRRSGIARVGCIVCLSTRLCRLSANVKAARSALERKVKSPRNFANGQSLIVTFVARAPTFTCWNDHLNPLKSPTSHTYLYTSHHTIFSLTLYLPSSSKLSHCLILRIPIRVSALLVSSELYHMFDCGHPTNAVFRKPPPLLVV